MSDVPAAQHGVVADLRAAGHVVDSVWELVHSGVRYPTAVPVLVDWMGRTRDGPTLDQIVRALSVPWARSATEPLLERFRRSRELGDRELGIGWVVGNALEVLYDDQYFEEFVTLATERSHGRDREMLVLALRKSRNPRAVRVLVDLIDDRDVSGHATRALARLGAPESREALESMLDDDRAWVRPAARQGLAKLGRPRSGATP